ncbi:MAG: primosomal protein N', partial [Deltaproteobacteria bacterium]
PYLRVAVALPVKETFFYAIPDNLLSKAEIGRRVLVPFRNRKVIGYILEKRSGNQEEGLKEILEVLDEEPLFPKGLVSFLQWMSEYYLYPIGRFIQSALPGGLNVRPFKTGRLTEKGLMALNKLPTHSQERRLLLWTKKNPGKRLPSPLHMAFSLQKKGWLIIESQIRKRRVGPLLRKFVRPKEGSDLNSILQDEGKSIRAKNEFEFLETVFNSDGILLKELSSKFSNGPYLVNKWIKKDILERYSAPVIRNLAGKVMFPSPVPSQLYDQQKEVLKEIQSRLKKRTFSTCLLHGVTGSGKTEVYYRAVEQAVRLGRQTLLMVPEIALAVYMEGIFRSRLGNRVAIYHSGLGGGERYDQWIRMVRGEVDLVIGARSALFAPLPKLGLIIVDEEHDFSYKQEEGPRYQARDAAVVRGRLEKALVILGSGTPSIQSFHHTSTGRYQLLSMPERIEKRPLPDVQIVDMKAVPEDEPGNGIISPALNEALEENLVEGKQAILFLNRRGFNRVYLCRSCGQSVRCYNCDLALIYHFKENRLACHYCGFHSQPQNRCSTCGHEGMKAYGFGTEKLEQELKEAFPETRIARMDRDSTRRKGQTFHILKNFSEHEIDIMVGTQMITKGYDFPDVTLVGVIAADLSLGFPDFRAGERTFQILSQVAGRAGRGDQKGRVIVQTFNPEHYAIMTAKDHDYPSFFQKEKELRKQLGYPPFSYLACLRLQGNNSKVTATMAQRVGRGIIGVLERWPKRGKEIQVLGPAEAPLAKLKGKYRWQILVKSKGAELLHYFLREIESLTRKMLRGSGVSLIVDVDPYQML